MKLLLSFISICLLSGCAAMQRDFVERSCNREGAFQKGYNDATAGQEMNNAWTTGCPAESVEHVQSAYREGFLQARSERPRELHISTDRPNRLGFECKESFGKKVCGYSCLEAFGNLKCAKFASHNCAEGFGQIKCGKNCRVEFGNVKCDRYEP